MGALGQATDRAGRKDRRGSLGGANDAQGWSRTPSPAPIVKGRVVIGNAGSEYAVRGYVSRAETRSSWKTYTVPGDPSQPFESRSIAPCVEHVVGRASGGRSAAGQPKGLHRVRSRSRFGLCRNGKRDLPGTTRFAARETIFIASILALRADAGEQVWHYQTTPGDNWDYDATQPLVLATLSIDGQQRRAS